MTIVSAPAAAAAPLLALACPTADVPHGLAAAARLLLPHLERGQRIDAARCAPPWSAPSAAPMRPAPGTGRPPTTPARPRRSCSCASSAPPCAPTPRRPRRVLADAGQGRGSAAHAYAPLRGEPGAAAVLDADRARLRRRHGGRAHARPISCSSPRPGPGCSPSSPSSPAPARPERARRDPRRTARPALSRRLRSPGTTPPTSTTISTAALRPSVVLMNPPFSVAAHVDGAVADAALRHVASALARLADGGRLVAITGASLSPDNPAWRDAFVRLQERGRVVFSAAIDGRVYARHGTTIETRLTVIDRRAGRRSERHFRLRRAWRPMRPRCSPGSLQHVPPRLPVDGASLVRGRLRASSLSAPSPHLRHAPRRARRRRSSPPAPSSPTRPSTGRRPRTAASPRRSTKATRCSRSASPARSRIRRGSCSRPRWPRSRRPSPPTGRTCRPTSSPTACCPTPSSRASSMPARPMPAISPDRGRSTRPSMSSRPRPTTPRTPCASGAAGSSATAPAPARAARSPASSSTTGCKGRRRAVWISKSDKLIEDAQRDWSALGQERLLITPLARFRQGTPIRLEQGILFTTYATLRTDAREERVSRVQQIVDWLGRTSTE